MRFHQWSSLPFALGLLVCACNRHGGVAKGAPGANPSGPGTAGPAPDTADQAPRGLVYATDPAVYGKGVPIAPNLPYASGGQPSAYASKPALPAGLTLDPATGAISGTPKDATPKAIYEVTASNRAGSTSTTLTITVNDQAPTEPPVVTVPAFMSAAKTGLTASTKDQGQAMTYEWTLMGGTLTAGQGTPSITFQAGEPGTLTAQVKVGNSGGSLTSRAEGHIVPLPDGNLTVPSVVRPGEDWMTASVTSQPGMTYTWSIQPGTSGATILSGQGTGSIRFASQPVLGTFGIQVKIVNQAGDSAIAQGQVKVSF